MSDRPGHRLDDDATPTPKTGFGLAVTGLIISVIAVLIAYFVNPTPPAAPTTALVATIDSLRSEVRSLRSEVATIQTKVDTTGTRELAAQVASLTILTETLHGRYDALQIDVNRHIINAK